MTFLQLLVLLIVAFKFFHTQAVQSIYVPKEMLRQTNDSVHLSFVNEVRAVDGIYEITIKTGLDIKSSYRLLATEYKNLQTECEHINYDECHAILSPNQSLLENLLKISQELENLGRPAVRRKRELVALTVGAVTCTMLSVYSFYIHYKLSEAEAAMDRNRQDINTQLLKINEVIHRMQKHGVSLEMLQNHSRFVSKVAVSRANMENFEKLLGNVNDLKLPTPLIAHELRDKLQAITMNRGRLSDLPVENLITLIEPQVIVRGENSTVFIRLQIPMVENQRYYNYRVISCLNENDMKVAVPEFIVVNDRNETALIIDSLHDNIAVSDGNIKLYNQPIKRQLTDCEKAILMNHTSSGCHFFRDQSSREFWTKLSSFKLFIFNPQHHPVSVSCESGRKETVRFRQIEVELEPGCEVNGSGHQFSSPHNHRMTMTAIDVMKFKQIEYPDIVSVSSMKFEPIELLHERTFNIAESHVMVLSLAVLFVILFAVNICVIFLVVRCCFKACKCFGNGKKLPQSKTELQLRTRFT
jgi:hypothetical protein